MKQELIDFKTACTKGDLNKVKELQNQYHIRFFHPDQIQQGLNKAISVGHLEVVKYLVKEGGAELHDIEIIVGDRKGEYLPLFWAAFCGQLHIVKYLIEEEKVDPHFYNDHILLEATEYGHIAIVEYIFTLQPSIYWMTHSNKDIRELYKLFTIEDYSISDEVAIRLFGPDFIDFKKQNNYN